MHAEAVLLVDDRKGQVVELHVGLEQCVRADQNVDLARLQPLQQLRARTPLLAPRQQPDAQTGPVGERRDGFRVLAGQHLGRRHQGRLRAGFHRDRHRHQRHHGLAGADVALQQAQHAERGRDVLRDLLQRLALRVGEGERQRIGDPRPDAAVADDAPPRLLLEALPHQRQRQLPGQQLVVGEALPRRRARRHVGGLLRPMQPRKRALDIGPAALLQPGRFLPLGQHRHALDRLLRRLQQDLAREARSERIYRLQHRQIVARFRRHDVVGMRHLLLVVVGLDASAHVADASLRQLPFDEFALRMEEHQIDAPGFVLARDLVGRLVVAARRRAMLEDPHLERGNGARHGRGHGRRCAPVDDPAGRMPEQIDHPRLVHPRRQPHGLFEQKHHARADAAQVRRGGKQGYEGMRPHGIRECVSVAGLRDACALCTAPTRHRRFCVCPRRTI